MAWSAMIAFFRGKPRFEVAMSRYHTRKIEELGFLPEPEEPIQMILIGLELGKRDFIATDVERGLIPE